MSFGDDAAPEPGETPPRDLVTAALDLVARMTPAEREAFSVHMRYPLRPLRLVGAERPAALAAMHDPADFAGDP